MIQYHKSTFTSIDDLHLYEQSWQPEDTKAIVVIVHGLGEHSGRYRHVAAYLNQGGYAVYTFDLRGHGKSEGERCFVRSFDEYVSDLCLLVAQVKKQHPDKPIFMLGHSMGGGIATLYASQKQSLLNGLILSAPSLMLTSDISPLLIKLSNVIARLFPRLKTVKLNSQVISRDPEVVNGYDTDPLNYRAGTPAATGAALIRSIKEIEHQMEKLSLPLLILHGTADRLTNIEGSRQLYARARSKQKMITLYEGFYHEILNEPEKERVLADIVKWMESILVVQNSKA